MASYRKRIADDILEYKLSAMGAVLVEGAKWCGKTLINEGIVTLHKLSGLIKAKGMKEPKFMMVLTGTGSFAHEEDGVFVCPLSALKQ